MAFKLSMYLFLVVVIVGALHVQGSPKDKLFRRQGTYCLPVNSNISLRVSRSVSRL